MAILVLGVLIMVVIVVVIVTVIVFSLSMAQMRAHLPVVGHGAGLHERHARQHRFTAQQPSLCTSTTTNKQTNCVY